jgi:hypothetical protein
MQKAANLLIKYHLEKASKQAPKNKENPDGDFAKEEDTTVDLRNSNVDISKLPPSERQQVSVKESVFSSPFETQQSLDPESSKFTFFFCIIFLVVEVNTFLYVFLFQFLFY